MIRISIEHQSRQRTVLKVEGDLAGSAVGIMGREGEISLKQSEKLVLDFSSIHLIDAAGVALLQAWSKHLLVRSCRPYIRLFLAQHEIPVEGGGDNH